MVAKKRPIVKLAHFGKSPFKKARRNCRNAELYLLSNFSIGPVQEETHLSKNLGRFVLRWCFA
jgi:hypothetical protein